MKRRHCRMGDPEFGPLCACGGPKAKQAWTCQRCHGRLRGYGRSAALQALLTQGGPLRSTVEASGELAELIAQQQRDDRRRFVWDPHTIPLEAPNRAGRTLIEVLPA